jgi:hypothetical protein
MSEKKPQADYFDESITDLSNDSGPSERLEMLNAIMAENYSTKNIGLKTELNMAQIMAYSKGLLFARWYKNPVIPILINKIMELSLSHKRASRKETEHIYAAMLQGISQPEMSPASFGDRLMGKQQRM